GTLRRFLRMRGYDPDDRSSSSGSSTPPIAPTDSAAPPSSTSMGPTTSTPSLENDQKRPVVVTSRRPTAVDGEEVEEIEIHQAGSDKDSSSGLNLSTITPETLAQVDFFQGGLLVPILELLRDDEYEPAQLLDALNRYPVLAQLYAQNTCEGCTVREHTRIAFGYYQRNFRESLQVDPEYRHLLEMVLALHAVGQGLDVSQSSSEEAYAEALLRNLLPELGFIRGNSEDLAILLMNNDLFGQYLDRQIAAPEVVAELNILAEQAELPLGDFFALLEAAYLSIMAAYIYNPNEQNFIDHLAQRMNFLRALIHEDQNSLFTVFTLNRAEIYPSFLQGNNIWRGVRRFLDSSNIPYYPYYNRAIIFGALFGTPSNIVDYDEDLFTYLNEFQEVRDFTDTNCAIISLAHRGVQNSVYNRRSTRALIDIESDDEVRFTISEGDLVELATRFYQRFEQGDYPDENLEYAQRALRQVQGLQSQMRAIREMSFSGSAYEYFHMMDIFNHEPRFMQRFLNMPIEQRAHIRPTSIGNRFLRSFISSLEAQGDLETFLNQFTALVKIAQEHELTNSNEIPIAVPELQIFHSVLNNMQRALLHTQEELILDINSRYHDHVYHLHLNPQSTSQLFIRNLGASPEQIAELMLDALDGPLGYRWHKGHPFDLGDISSQLTMGEVAALQAQGAIFKFSFSHPFLEMNDDLSRVINRRYIILGVNLEGSEPFWIDPDGFQHFELGVITLFESTHPPQTVGLIR
ncbi:MAG: hypothetical protein KKE11_06450, partial [Gammaproteobacteria bacterium]|nr:hypothetical protein [Gammaproteobacteria bacterium]